MKPPPPISFDDALRGIASRAQGYDRSNDWPFEDIEQLHAAGAMRWALPVEFGGEGLSPFELHLRYEQLAAASVATALILTQRDAAAGLIELSADLEDRPVVLNRLANKEIWATVGFAQLTTSRQRGGSAVKAQRVAGGYLVDGTIPWCTGSQLSVFIVAGAMLEDRQQILFLLHRGQRGMQQDEAMKLVALTSTNTGSIQLRRVFVRDSWVLRGPMANVLGGRRTSLILGQTFIATGLTQSALNLIIKHDSDRAWSAHEQFAKQLAEARAEVAELCQPGSEADASAANARLRGTCNDLALRAAHAAIALYKGAALLRDHPAQRLAREAMFLLVWSCPDPVIDCTVDLLAKG